MNQIGIGLSDEEIKALSKLPIVRKAELFAPAEVWYGQHKERLVRDYAGKTVAINAGDCTHVVGDDSKKILDLYDQQFGPPPKVGRHMLIVLLRPAASKS